MITFASMKAIRTTISSQKAERNNEIITRYSALISISGSQRTAVAEEVASQLGCHFQTVMRVTKRIKK